jgi:hypothetical protein
MLRARLKNVELCKMPKLDFSKPIIPSIPGQLGNIQLHAQGIEEEPDAAPPQIRLRLPLGRNMFRSNGRPTSDLFLTPCLGIVLILHTCLIAVVAYAVVANLSAPVRIIVSRHNG